MPGAGQPPPSGEPTLQTQTPAWSPNVSTLPGAVHNTAPTGPSLATGAADLAGMEPAALLPGTVIADTFRIERPLGAGAMGMVFLATHLPLDRLVALKVHRAARTIDVARLAREAKALARVQHPNVVGIYDVREFGGVLFVAMEFVDGSNARSWLRREGLLWQARLDMCLQAAAGLSAAHAAGLVHRDFKPENILVARDGRVAVADFGLAKAAGAPVDAQPGGSGSLDAQLTAEGAIAGTPAYMSPEQWAAKPVDARADVFALSVVIYEALYGKRPFGGTSAPELAFAVAEGHVRPPPADSDVPPGIYPVLCRGLRTDARQRTPTVQALVTELRHVLRAPGLWGVGMAIGLCLLVFGVVAGAAALMWKGSAEEEPVLVEEAAPPEVDEALVAEAVASERLKRADGAVARMGDLDLLGDPDAVGQSLTEVMDAYSRNEASLGALVGAAKSAVDHTNAQLDKRGYTRATWDGATTFVCGMHERVELRDVTAVVEDGPAIEVRLGCGLRLVDVDIEADVIVSGTAAHALEIEGGSFRAKTAGVEVGMVETVTIRSAEFQVPDGVGVSLGMRTSGTLEDTQITAATALIVGMHSKVKITRGRLEGKTALKTEMHAKVQTRDAHLKGKVARGLHSTVRDVSGEPEKE